MKTINLFLDFEFSSLSPDAQPISIGIVSDDKLSSNNPKYPIGIVGWDYQSAKNLAIDRGLTHRISIDKGGCVLLYRPEHFCSLDFSEIITPKQVDDKVPGYELSDEMQYAVNIARQNRIVTPECVATKSFYAEFSDFDINRCDDWVKSQVLTKLKHKDLDVHLPTAGGDFITGKGDTDHVKYWLKRYLSQFSDYQVQIVVDCGTWDFYHFLQLVGEWEEKGVFEFDANAHQLENVNARHEAELKLFRKAGGRKIVREIQHSPIKMSGDVNHVCASIEGTSGIYIINRVGLPKLPANISPVPLDLNDLIAFKHNTTAREAFNVNREFEWNPQIEVSDQVELWGKNGKHNALWDAKVIKQIFNKIS